jgi:hypothetical protein
MDIELIQAIKNSAYVLCSSILISGTFLYIAEKIRSGKKRDSIGPMQRLDLLIMENTIKYEYERCQDISNPHKQTRLYHALGVLDSILKDEAPLDQRNFEQVQSVYREFELDKRVPLIMAERRAAQAQRHSP